MTVAKRTFGKPASLNHLMTAGKEFTDAAMDVDIAEVLNAAKFRRRIGVTAAKLSGVSLQREGDMDSQRLVFAAYDTLHDLMSPALREHGADAAQELFTTGTTHATLLGMSRTIDSYALSKMAHDYRTRGSYLKLTDNGLELDDIVLPKEFDAQRGGCPYAKSDDSPYFTRFTDHIVDTYTEAHRQNLPHGLFEATGRLLRRT